MEQTYIAFLRQIRVAISNLQLYGLNNSLVKESMQNCFNIINDIFSTQDALTISESEKVLLANGKRIDIKSGADKNVIDSIVASLHSLHIKSFTINIGVRLEELSALTEFISQKKPAVDINTFLNSKQVKHITANEKVYVAVGKEEEKEEQPKTFTANGVTISKQETEIKNDIVTEPPAKKAVSPIELGKTLLNKENSELLQDDTKQIVENLIKELDSVDHAQLASEILDKFAANLDSQIAENRLKTVQSFKTFSKTIDSLSDKKIRDKLEDKFISAEDVETSEPVYVELADLLEYGTNRLIAEGVYEKIMKIVAMFRRHISTPQDGFLTRVKCAKNVLDKIANRYVVGILISDLRSDNPINKEQAYAVIMKLQDAAVPQLIEVLKETEDLHLRKIVGLSIKNMGASAISQLLESINNEGNPKAITRILEILDGIGVDETVASHFRQKFINYPISTKKEILKVLYKIKSSVARETIIDAINDSNNAIKLIAIELAGKLKEVNAIDKLIALSQNTAKQKLDENEREMLQKKICEAFGLIENQKAIPILNEMASPPAFLSFKSKNKNVRITATVALGHFINEEAKKTIEVLLKDKDEMIRRAAQEAKEYQESIVRKKGEKLAQHVL